MTSSAPRANFNYPSSYRLGCGRIRELPDICAELSISRPLIVTDGGVRALSWFEDVVGFLGDAGLSAAIFSDVSENPVEDDVARGVDAYRVNGCNGVILLGGGSPLDVGKCIALLADNPGTVFDYEDVGDNYKKADPQKIAPMIAVPTTSGTGSEVGRASVVTNSAHEKKIIFHPKMQPPVVLADPELTFGLPPHLTAFTGLDAFIHCFEAYCAPGYHPMADGIALQGMHLIASALPRVVADGHDAVARTDMMMASSMGATAFQKGLGVVHALSHALGGRLKVHHGLANAIALPYCMKFNESVIEGRCRDVAERMNLPEASFSTLLDWVITSRQRFGVPDTLAEIPGMGAELIPELARVAKQDPSLGTNPQEATEDELGELLERALFGRL